MAKYGQIMLKQLRLQYCDFGGASAGMREFLHHHLPALVAEAGSQGVDVRAELKRGAFPLLRAVYRPLTSGGAERARSVGVKNLSAREVGEHVRWLRDSQGRSTGKRVPPRHVISARRSVQGEWSPATWGGGAGGEEGAAAAARR